PARRVRAAGSRPDGSRRGSAHPAAGRRGGSRGWRWGRWWKRTCSSWDVLRTSGAVEGHHAGCQAPFVAAQAAERAEPVDEGVAVLAEGVLADHDQQHPGDHERGVAQLLGGDRKSTRLNSSHVKTSYAVVCLKKKIEHVQIYTSVIR